MSPSTKIGSSILKLLFDSVIEFFEGDFKGRSAVFIDDQFSLKLFNQHNHQLKTQRFCFGNIQISRKSHSIVTDHQPEFVIVLGLENDTDLSLMSFRERMF